MTGNKFFSKTDVNMGRQPEIDLSKAVVIFFLATIHVYVECSTEKQLWGGLPYFRWSLGSTNVYVFHGYWSGIYKEK